MAWTRNILRVNLTEGTCTPEPLNMQWANDYLGSRGLASKYLTEEVDPKVDPLSPDNKLIMSTGPLTGTMASTGGTLHGGHQGPADRRHCLLQLRRLLRRGDEVRGLGHDHFRGSLAGRRSICTWKTIRPSCVMHLICGARAPG